MTTLTINSEQYRIRRLDPSNFVIEKYVPPTKADRKKEAWAIMGYYGNLDDLAFGLIKYLVGIPEGQNILDQIVLLRREIKELHSSINQILESHHSAKTGIVEQVVDNPLPVSEAQL